MRGFLKSHPQLLLIARGWVVAMFRPGGKGGVNYGQGLKYHGYWWILEFLKGTGSRVYLYSIFTNIFVKVAWLLLKVDWMPISTAIPSTVPKVSRWYTAKPDALRHPAATSMGSGSRFDSVGWTLQPLCWCRATLARDYFFGTLASCHDLPWFS